MTGLLAGTLGEQELQWVQSHLDRCSTCVEWVAAACSVVQAEGRDAEAPPTHRYQVLEVLGRGGMGVVYRATDSVLEREVALKELRSSLLDAPGMRDRLARESKAMAALRHPNVVTVYDAFTDEDGALTIAMEYVPGQTLRSWLGTPEARSWTATLELLIQAGRGLSAAHAVGIVHRDFKPDNVLVDGSGRALVTDFGLADIHDDRTPFTTTSSETPPSVRGGTPAYMAPEQLAGGDADARADVFAFCVTAIEALWGVRPFPDGPPSARLDAIRFGHIDLPKRSRIPQRVLRALRSGLAADPVDRPATLDPLLVALGRRPSHRRRLMMGVAVLAAGLGAGALWLSPAERPACEVPQDPPWPKDGLRELAAALQDDGVAAQLTWSRVEPQLRGIRGQLDDAWTAACESGGDGRPAFVVDAELACLSEIRTTTATIVELATRTGDSSVGRALDYLAPPSHCEAEAPERAPLEQFDRDAARGVGHDLARLGGMNLLQVDDARGQAELALEQAMGVGSVWARIRAHRGMGGALLREDLGRALHHFAIAAELSRGTGLAVETAHTSMLVADLAASTQQPDLARRYLQLASESIPEIEPSSTRTRAEAQLALEQGVAAHYAGDQSTAAEHFDRAVELTRVHDPVQLPVALSARAGVALRLGDVDSALTDSLELVRWEETHAKHSLEHGLSLIDLAEVRIARGEPELAQDLVRRARQATTGGLPPVQDARAQMHLAQASIVADDPDAALHALDAAERAYGEAIVDYDRIILAELRATALLLRGNTEAARVQLTLALRTTPGLDPALEEFLLPLSNAIWKRGDRGRALRLVTTAWDILSAEPEKHPLALMSLTRWLGVHRAAGG